MASRMLTYGHLKRLHKSHTNSEECKNNSEACYCVGSILGLQDNEKVLGLGLYTIISYNRAAYFYMSDHIHPWCSTTNYVNSCNNWEIFTYKELTGHLLGRLIIWSCKFPCRSILEEDNIHACRKDT